MMTPITPVAFEVAGIRFQCMPLGLDEQFEVECILLSVLGPAAGTAIAALVEGVTPAFVTVLREATGSGDSFDLSKLMSRPASVEKLREHWAAALASLRELRFGDPQPVASLIPCESSGPAAERWLAVADELDRMISEADGDPAAIDISDRELQAAWGELLGALVVELHEAIDRCRPFDVAEVLPLNGPAAAPWRDLISASLSDVVRESAGRGTFDLAGLMRLDTADPRVRDIWEGLLTSLAGTVGDLVRGACYAIAGRLNVADVKRLFELCVLSKKLMLPRLANGYVSTYEALNSVLMHNPRAKWDLLIRCLLVTYARGPVAEGGDA